MLDNGDYITFGKSQKLTFIFRVATRRDAEELADYAFEEELGRYLGLGFEGAAAAGRRPFWVTILGALQA